MITEQQGDLFESGAEALVNAVNTVGVMGAGLALQFKHKYPQNYVAYRRAYQERSLVVGQPFVYSRTDVSNPKYIVNFPTKEHWKEPSSIEFISAGMEKLARWCEETKVASIAIPALGCGLGGLHWDEVKPIIVENLTDISDLAVLLYPPYGYVPQLQMF